MGALLVAAAVSVELSLAAGIVGVVVAATAVLAVARRSLELADTFPELERLPALKWLVGKGTKR